MRPHDDDDDPTDVTLDCEPGAEYSQALFRYFLSKERVRAGHSNQPVRLLFATVEPVPGEPTPIPAATAGKLFEGLRLSLRETDVIGWHQQGRVAGAVLCAAPADSQFEVDAHLERRVGEDLRRRLPSKAARSLHVRVVQMGPQRLVNE